jgi:hypothetical protein
MTPDPWVQVVVTNVDDVAALAAFAGAFESRSQARGAGMSGAVFPGFEVYGARNRTFFVWCPDGPRKPSPTMSRKRLLTAAWQDFQREFGTVTARQM